MFFRDRELSDRIGFVYQNWEPREAAEDLLARLRRIGREHGAHGVPLTTGPAFPRLFTLPSHACDGAA